MKRGLKEDLKQLQPLKDSLEKIQPWADSKLEALYQLFTREQVFDTGKKVVIFTQYVDTANYVYDDLKRTHKDKEIRILTGKTSKESRRTILMEFAPRANKPEREEVEKESNILVCSDVLSEGQNLQDCNFAVNFDLPWNPMKIIQRVGRVDRLTSEFPTVTSAVFFPKKNLKIY